MREIKFRAWVKDGVKYSGGRMWEVASITWRKYQDDGEPENITMKVVQDLDINEVGSFDCYTKTAWQRYSEDDFILMQYTGLKDKNDKEIYEGDIIHNSSFEPTISEIKWQREKNGFGEIWPPICIEVIGNIYENKGLLEER